MMEKKENTAESIEGKEIWVVGDMRSEMLFGLSLKTLGRARELACSASGKVAMVLFASSVDKGSKKSSERAPFISVEEAAETCLVAEAMYIDLAKLVEEKISMEKAIELWFSLGEKYRRLKSYVLAERAYRLAETYETAGKMYFDYAVELLMKKNLNSC